MTAPRAPALLVASALLAAAPVRAAEPPTSPGDAPARPRVEWSARWPRFRVWEYGATALFGGASLYLYRYRPPPEETRWQGDNAFDAAFRDWLRADTRQEREAAGVAGDVLWQAGTFMPYVIDVPVILLAHREPRVAWQVLMMDLEANAVAGFINGALFYQVGRGRPSVHDCTVDPSYDELCGGRSNNASFPSGHVLGIATAAGLTCAHHRHLPLYGHAVADAGVCAVMSAATVVTAATRIMADRHYATDSLAGAAIGFAVGYGLPRLLHYRAGAAVDDGRGARPIVVPFARPDALGLGVLGSM